MAIRVVEFRIRGYKIRDPVDFCLKLKLSVAIILKWNNGEPTKFGLIFTKQTFLKMTYRTHTIITHSKPTINSKNWANFYLTGVSCFLIFSYMNLGMYNIHKSNQQSKFWNWHFLAKFHPHDFDLVSIPTQCSVVAVELDRIFSNKKPFRKI